MKPAQLVLQFIGWLQIVLGVTICFGLAAIALYVFWPNNTMKIISIVLVTIGFIAGSVWATGIWKKHGTIEWLSRIRKTS